MKVNKFIEIINKLSNITNPKTIMLIGINILNAVYCGLIFIGGLFFFTAYEFSLIVPIILFGIVGVYNSIVLIKYYINKE